MSWELTRVFLDYHTKPGLPPTKGNEVTPWVRNVSIKRGRNYELNQYQSGTATFRLDNADGRFSPGRNVAAQNLLPAWVAHPELQGDGTGIGSSNDGLEIGNSGGTEATTTSVRAYSGYRSWSMPSGPGSRWVLGNDHSTIDDTYNVSVDVDGRYNMRVRGGVTYANQARLCLTSGTIAVTMEMHWYDPDGFYISTSTYAPTLTTSWQLCEQTAVAPTSAAYLRTGFYLDDSTSSYTIAMDDWFVYDATGGTLQPFPDYSAFADIRPGTRVYIGTELKNLLTNGGFETGDLSNWTATSGTYFTATSLAADPDPIRDSKYGLRIHLDGVNTTAQNIYQDIPVTWNGTAVTYTASLKYHSIVTGRAWNLRLQALNASGSVVSSGVSGLRGPQPDFVSTVATVTTDSTITTIRVRIDTTQTAATNDDLYVDSVRLTATDLRAMTSIFTGVIESAHLVGDGEYSEVEVQCSDGMGYLGGLTMDSALSGLIRSNSPLHYLPLTDSVDLNGLDLGDGVVNEGSATNYRLGRFVGGTTASALASLGQPGVNDYAGTSLQLSPTSTAAGCCVSIAANSISATGGFSAQGGFTTQGWFKTSTTSGTLPWQQSLYLERPGSRLGQKSFAYEHYQVSINTAGNLVFDLYSNGSIYATLTSTTNVADGNWHHVAVQVDQKTSTRLWVDYDGHGGGESLSSPSHIVNWGTSARGGGLYLGGDYDNGNQLFQGYLAHWSVHNKVLAASVVSDLVSAGSGNGTFSGDTEGTRIGRVLDWSSWGTGTYSRALDASQSTLQSMSVGGQSALELVQSVAQSAGGFIFVDGAGRFVFKNRQSRYGASPVMTVSGEPMMPENDLTFTLDNANIYNAVTVKRLYGVSAMAEDQASQVRYGKRTQNMEVQVFSDSEAVDAANWLVYLYAEPTPRPSVIRFDLTAGDGLWQYLPSFELGGNMLRLSFLANMSQYSHLGTDYFIESVTFDIDAEQRRFTVQMDLSPAWRQAGVIVLDHPVTGFLDSPYVLGY